MLVRLSELRRVIREAVVLGWPDAEVIHVYGVPDRMADEHQKDLGDLKLPKGPNSRDDAEDRKLTDKLPGKHKKSED